MNRILFALLRSMLSLRYHVRISGLDTVMSKGARGILFLANHPAYVDPLILVSRLKRDVPLSILADQDRIDIPLLGRLIRRMDVIALPDPIRYGSAAADGVASALGECAHRLEQGDNVLLYPAGRVRLSWQEDLGAASAVGAIVADAPAARVVLVRIRGLWGSSFSRLGGRKVSMFGCVARGVILAIANGLFFMPRRDVSIEFSEPADFPGNADRRTQNRYLEAWYNREREEAIRVPYHFLNGGTVVLPEVETVTRLATRADVPEALRAIVVGHLIEESGVRTISDADDLARDIGMDSLARMELLVWLSQEFGVSVSDPEALRTVADVLLAAHGHLISGPVTVRPADAAWHAERSRSLATIPSGDFITEVFLRQAKRSLRRPATASQSRGVMTYQDIITAIMVLKPRLEALKGEYLGIMFPAVSAAPVFYLAALFAGKIPVMINWTAGIRAVRHSLDHLGVETVITSSEFVTKIEAQGTDLSDVRGRFLIAEDLGKRIGTLSKLSALVRSRLSWRSLYRVRPARHAVVLFTSGSENLPKAVPLTHQNILTNVRDVFRSYPLTESDVILGMLPPFHSFGLTCTMIMPLLAGMRAAYHPNPTEGNILAKLVKCYGVTMLVGTPTFIGGIVRGASPEDLQTVTRVITGAEKCPETLLRAIAQTWPSMRILEGYGITECSPIVSANRDNDIRFGSIGRIFPSVEYAIIDPERPVRVPTGVTGMLLVRGDSVFEGYIKHDGESPFVEFEGKSWYRTGDLVTESGDGVLTFAGRLKRFIKMGGEMISLPAIESSLIAVFQNPDDEISFAVEGVGEGDAQEVVLFTTKPIGREEVNAVIRAAGFSPLHLIRKVVSVERIPLLGSGKTDYRALKALAG